MKSHPRLGADMLFGNGFGEPIAVDICLHDLEKMGGDGYPSMAAIAKGLHVPRWTSVLNVWSWPEAEVR